MCGRYYIDDDTVKEIEKIANRIHEGLNTVKKGDIFPSNTAPILVQEKQTVSPILSTWGIPSHINSSLIINARAETALDKKMFKESLRNRRCIIPATKFYEWNKQKEKYDFTDPESHTIYMLGFYLPSENDNRFVILTTSANDSVLPVHDRMPLLLPRELCTEWIINSDKTQEFLQSIPSKLKKNTEYNQMRLDL